MDALTIVIVAVIILLGLIIGGAVAFSRFNPKSTPALKPQPGNDYSPGAGDDGPGLVDPAQKTVETMGVRDTRADPTTTIEEIAPAQWEVEVPEPAAGRGAGEDRRADRLRAVPLRLARDGRHDSL